jgi:magnesium chelatase family protein
VQIQRYRARVSGPLLDRIDIHVEVPSVRYRELAGDYVGEPSVRIRKRVNEARVVQMDRLKKDGAYCNSQMKPRHLKKFCSVDDETSSLLENAVERLGLSARAYNRILKVARTIADLDGREKIGVVDVAEAIQYRSLDRKLH